VVSEVNCPFGVPQPPPREPRVNVWCVQRYKQSLRVDRRVLFNSFPCDWVEYIDAWKASVDSFCDGGLYLADSRAETPR
jgi:hypothetical protein